jgi:hypothetical protein
MEKKEEKKESSKKEKEEKPTGFNFDFSDKKVETPEKPKETNSSGFNFNFSESPSFNFQTKIDVPQFSFGNEKFDFQSFSGLSDRFETLLTF